LNLNTHFLFAAAAAALVSGKPEAIVLAGLGSVIPDLDRAYWFIPKRRIAEEEYHRALLHNLIVLALAYLFNPYLGLGILSHLMLDNMTTVKDRGVEWLFPFTRMVSGDYWSQAEVQSEPPAWVPWRRTYGPALNGHMLDTYVFLASAGVLFSWSLFQSLHHAIPDVSYWLNAGFIALAGTVFFLFVSGECCNRWLDWSSIKRIVVLTLLAVALVCMILMGNFFFPQGMIFSWSSVPNGWLLRADDFLSGLFLTSAVAYVLIILRFIRTISVTLANSFPALCTRMPSRDFIIDEKTGSSDVFV